MSVLLGVDYGGTRTKLLVAERDGPRLRTIRRAEVASPHGAEAIPALAALIEEFLAGDAIDSFGVTVAGILDDDQDVVLVSTNMPWLQGRSFAAELGGLLGVAGVAVHDGGAAARAEAILGAGKEHSDIFVVALGTGIAGAHVIDGEVRRGAHGAAGEIGHLATGVGRICSCGQRGCLESEMGGRMLAARWDEIVGAPGSTARDLVDAAESGDERARDLLDEATSALARTLLAMIALLDPGVIVIGGGLSAARRWIVEPALIKTRAGASFHRIPPILVAELGTWAGAWGGILAAERLIADRLESAGPVG